jgi:hypothetical protein
MEFYYAKRKNTYCPDTIKIVFRFRIWAHFFADYRKKTGLSAPIPRPPAGGPVGFPLLSLARLTQGKPAFSLLS